MGAATKLSEISINWRSLPSYGNSLLFIAYSEVAVNVDNIHWGGKTDTEFLILEVSCISFRFTVNYTMVTWNTRKFRSCKILHVDVCFFGIINIRGNLSRISLEITIGVIYLHCDPSLTWFRNVVM